MQIFTLVQQAPWNMQQLEHKLMINILPTDMDAPQFCLHWPNLVSHTPWNTNTSRHKFLFEKFHQGNLIPDNTSFTYRALPFHSTCKTSSVCHPVSVYYYYYYYYSEDVSAPILTHCTTST